METEVVAGRQLEVLYQGMFLLVNLKPVNAEWYPWSHVIAEIDYDISHLDTTIETTELEVQIYRPSGRTVSLDKKIIRWQGDDNKYFRPTIQRGMVKAILQMHLASGKLTKQSKKVISSLML